MDIIEFNNFSYVYPNGYKALDNVTIKIPRGSFTVITGPNGAGKTTFCQAIAGIVPHYYGGSMAGKVIVNGINVINSSMSEIASQVSIMLEDYESQLVAVTVEEEVAFCLENKGLSIDEISEEVDKCLKMTGLSAFKKHETAHLSGGQKQRLVIASLLAMNPGILVLDEPASALDPKGAVELYELLSQLNRQYNITVIVVEHELDRIVSIATNIILFLNGRIIEAGDCSKVFRYMWKDEYLKKAVPSLWSILFALEANDTTGISDWFRRYSIA